MGLDQLKREVNKKYKSELMVKGSKVKQYARFPTGSLALDLELGGGIPLGKIITVVGEYSDGKTSLVLKMVAEYQKAYPHKDVLWMDVEGSFDYEWAQTLGVPNELWLVQPEYQQQAFDIINKAIEYDVGLIVVDSIAALVPKEEAEGSFEDYTIGLAARINSKAMRGFQSTLNTKAANEDPVPPTIILINQLRDTISSSPYKSQTEPGGRAIGFHSAVKIYLRKGDLYPKPKSNYDVDIVPKAQQIKFYIEKNKTAPPKKRGWTWFYFDTLDSLRRKGTIDHIEELVRYCRDYEVIREVSKGRFEFIHPTTGEVEKIHGINTFAAKIREYPDLVPSLREELLKRVSEQYESDKPEQQLDDSEEQAIDKEEREASSEDITSLSSDSFWSDTLGEAGSENGSVSDSAQTSWEKLPPIGAPRT